LSWPKVPFWLSCLFDICNVYQILDYILIVLQKWTFFLEHYCSISFSWIIVENQIIKFVQVWCLPMTGFFWVLNIDNSLQLYGILLLLLSSCYGYSSVVVCVTSILPVESWSWNPIVDAICLFLCFLGFYQLSLCKYDIWFRVMGIGLTLLHWVLNMFFALGLLTIQASNILLQRKWRR
jgi:hypothetical protein